jgi:hypothetical protein
MDWITNNWGWILIIVVALFSNSILNWLIGLFRAKLKEDRATIIPTGNLTINIHQKALDEIHKHFGIDKSMKVKSDCSFKFTFLSEATYYQKYNLFRQGEFVFQDRVFGDNFKPEIVFRMDENARFIRIWVSSYLDIRHKKPFLLMKFPVDAIEASGTEIKTKILKENGINFEPNDYTPDVYEDDFGELQSLDYDTEESYSNDYVTVLFDKFY